MAASRKLGASRQTRITEALLFALLAVVMVHKFVIPGLRELRTDFPNYYLAARLRIDGVPLDRAYEWNWFQRQKDHYHIEQPLVGFAPHPPLCAVPFLPVARMQPLSAKRVWLAGNLLFLAIAMWAAAKALDLPLTRGGWLTLLCLVPLGNNFVIGQYYVLILLLISLAFYLYKKHPEASGATLAVAASLKIFPVVLVLVFLRHKNWRALWGFLAAGLGLLLLSVGLFGVTVHRVFLTEVLPRAATGDLLAPSNLQWSSFSALLHRLFLMTPGGPPPLLDSHLVYSILKAAIAALALGLFWWSGRCETDAQRDLQWATAIALSLLMSSMPSSYHYTVLTIAICIAVTRLWQRPAPLCLALGAYAVIGAGIAGTAGYPGLSRLLAMTVFFGALVAAQRPLHFRLASLATVSAVFVVLLVSSMVSLRDREWDFDRRIPINGAFRESDPAVNASGLAFIAMKEDGYHAATWGKDDLWLSLPIAPDVLQLATTRNGNDLFLERADGPSQILRVAGRQGIKLTDGESPVLSPGGTLLAFVRERAGRGTLWVRNLKTGSEWQVLGTDDVYEASFLDDESLAVAAKFDGEPHLVSVALAGGAPRPLLPEPARYPAVSPDGTKIAFSRREGDSWHLYVSRVKGGHPQQIGKGHCNSITPAWNSDRELIFATDCGAGLGLSGLARIQTP